MPPSPGSWPERVGTTAALPRWRTRPLLDVLLLNGRPHVIPAPGGPLSAVDCAKQATRALFRLLAAARSGAGAEELVAVNHDLGAPAATEILILAVETGLVVPENSPDPGDSPAIPYADRHVRRQHRIRRARHYHDYASPTVYAEDAARMRARLVTEPPPAPEPAVAGPVLRLPHPAVSGPWSPLAALGHLLFHGFGLLRPATFLDTLAVQLRPVPSFGARHPFDAVVVLPPGTEFEAPPGRYRYLPSRHSLVHTGGVPATRPAARLEIRAVYERVQWRYRHAFAYEMVLLDLGHLRQQLRLCAPPLGIELTERAPDRSPLRLSDETVTSYEMRRLADAGHPSTDPAALVAPDHLTRTGPAR